MIKAMGRAAFLTALTLGMAGAASAAVQLDQDAYCASVASERCFTKYGQTSVECEDAEYRLCMSEPWSGGLAAMRQARGTHAA